jgi:hypothetical protein
MDKNEPEILPPEETPPQGNQATDLISQDRIPGSGRFMDDLSTEIMFWDRNNPRSLVNLVPPLAAKKLEAARLDPYVAEILDIYDESQMVKELRDIGYGPTATDNRLRLKFWVEYDYAQSNNLKQLDVKRIVAGICSQAFFYTRYLDQPRKVAWLLCPPSGYMAKSEEALTYGLGQLRELLEMPHIDPHTGKLDTKLGELKLKIVALLDQRVKGAVVQKSMNLHAVTGAQAYKSLTGAMEKPSMDDLESRLKRLDQEVKLMGLGGEYSGKRETPDETFGND